jgi:hypothetical protein
MKIVEIKTYLFFHLMIFLVLLLTMRLEVMDVCLLACQRDIRVMCLCAAVTVRPLGVPESGYWRSPGDNIPLFCGEQ